MNKRFGLGNGGKGREILIKKVKGMEDDDLGNVTFRYGNNEESLLTVLNYYCRSSRHSSIVILSSRILRTR